MRSKCEQVKVISMILLKIYHSDWDKIYLGHPSMLTRRDDESYCGELRMLTRVIKGSYCCMSVEVCVV